MQHTLKALLACLPLGLWACPGDEEATLDLNNPPPKTFRVLLSGEEIIGHGISLRDGGHGHGHGDHEIYFADGWTLTFESAIVTIANVQLSENPDMSAGEQSMTGPVVAELDGVFAVDFKNNGGFGSHRHDYALGILSKQNKKNKTPGFDSKTRYAFGYSLVPATPKATQLNFTEASKATYERMQANGWSIFVSGTAKHEGEHCTASTSYAFERLPQEFRFELGFNMPVNYKNCENPQVEFRRGVQVKENAPEDVVVSLHFDHLFWEALEEDASLRLDAWAASKSAGGAPMPLVTNADLAKVRYSGVEDAQGNAVPFRSCEGAPGRTEPQLHYKDHGKGGGLKNLNDFIQYNLSTFGHLNGNGLCAPQRL